MFPGRPFAVAGMAARGAADRISMVSPAPTNFHRGTSISEPVPAVGRVLDVVGLVVFLAGAGLYGRAWLGLRHLRETQPVGEGARDFAAMARFTELSQTSRIGIWLMVCGGLVAVTAMVVARVASED